MGGSHSDTSLTKFRVSREITNKDMTRHSLPKMAFDLSETIGANTGFDDDSSTSSLSSESPHSEGLLNIADQSDWRKSSGVEDSVLKIIMSDDVDSFSASTASSMRTSMTRSVSSEPHEIR